MTGRLPVQKRGHKIAMTTEAIDAFRTEQRTCCARLARTEPAADLPRI